MIRVGITGQSGFVGTHLFDALEEQALIFERIPFEDAFFEEESKLRTFVRKCDVIVHLAAMMRSPIEGEVYKVNMRLVNQLIAAMESENVRPCILFSSSIQESNSSEYGRCKKEGREILENWAKANHTGFLGLMFPNLFGPGARPNSHSFVATFCYKLTHNEKPQILVDNTIPLKYIGNLKNELVDLIKDLVNNKDINTINIEPEFEMTVTDVLYRLESLSKGKKPHDAIDEVLYETLISYID